MAEIDLLWDYNDPAKTESLFRERLATSNGPDRVELLTQIARAQGLQRRFAEAHATLDEATSLLREDQPVPHIRYLLERGRVFNSSKEIEKAAPQFIAAWELACEAGEDSYAIDAAHMLGICMPPKEAIAWNEKALALAETSKMPRARKWLGPLYNNMGWTYHDMGNFTRALELFEGGVKIREQLKQVKETQIAKYCVGRALRSLGRVQEAMKIQESLLAEQLPAGTTDGYGYEELGECCLLLNRLEEARAHFAKAYAELSKDPWLAESESGRLERMRKLGE